MSTPPTSPEPPAEPADHIAKLVTKESRNLQMMQEDELAHSLKPFRVGSVGFLNAVPLTRGLEEDVLFTTPSRLAAMLQRDELDAALVSVTEPLLHDRYDILDGIAVASLGEVKSVYLAHRGPLEEAREIHCDPASLTSVNLLRVLLAERGLRPEFRPLASYDAADLPDYTLLIGDPAITYLLGQPTHDIWDLGEAWREMTGLPFVFAVWAMRRGVDTGRLGQLLRSARTFGLDTLDTIIHTRPEFTESFRRDYLGWHIHYHLGEDEKAGLKRFMELMDRHGLGPVYPPRFV